MSVLEPGAPPQKVTLDGRYCRLEPLEERHADALWAAISGEGLEARYRYMSSRTPIDAEAHRAWVRAARDHAEWLYLAVLDQGTGLCGGRHAFMRIRPEHRSVEIGDVLWGRGISRTRIATEAFFLTARYVFQTLGYRRFEWKCNDLNLPSMRAALRFGFRFEGIFRKDMIVKGENRDTAWFSMLDEDWPELKKVYEAWLDPDNFDADGQARARLATTR
ncbi:MAG: GNAT family N-acetyltransferase [Alphaproteobacteria bacterium]|nr:GNAT family N-acetyltransferase [Alphaproteobacteria bacterium]